MASDYQRRRNDTADYERKRTSSTDMRSTRRPLDHRLDARCRSPHDPLSGRPRTLLAKVKQHVEGLAGFLKSGGAAGPKGDPFGARRLVSLCTSGARGDPDSFKGPRGVPVPIDGQPACARALRGHGTRPYRWFLGHPSSSKMNKRAPLSCPGAAHGLCSLLAETALMTRLLFVILLCVLASGTCAKRCEPNTPGAQ
jgi:hypothetical protein